MGIFDRFRPGDESRGRTYEGQRMEPSEDEQALARYRYMLKTAPPETIEQAHVEAFVDADTYVTFFAAGSSRARCDVSVRRSCRQARSSRRARGEG